MSSKLQKLTILKQKVAAMQQDIRIMEHTTQKRKQMPEFLKPVHKITHRDRKNLLSQTLKDISYNYRERQNFFFK